VRRFPLFVAALLALMASCARGSVPAEGSTDSGIEGTVLLGPTCPVETIEHPCPDRPLAADVLVSTPSGEHVATVRSGADGRFRVGLAPGTYTLNVGKLRGIQFAKPLIVTVPDGGFVEVTVSVDSGIR
jgi:hypothetical protein